MSSHTKGAIKKRPVSSKYAKRMLLEKKSSKKARKNSKRPAELLVNFCEAVIRESKDIIDMAEIMIAEAEEHMMDEATDLRDEDKKKASAEAEAVILSAEKPPMRLKRSWSCSLVWRLRGGLMRLLR